jgi:hypothetical protein
MLPRLFRRRAAPLGLLIALAVSGCLISNRGTPVFVDARAGSFWSGKGMLLEVSEDRLRCLVRVRDRALIARDRWVECGSVHPR